jgi:hypothetical protein
VGGGASTVNRHDCVFLGEGHRVAPVRVLIEFHTPSWGPRDHKTLHHVAVLELVPDGVHVVCAGLFEESLEVFGRQTRLTLVTMHDSHDAPLAGTARHPIIGVVIVGRGCNPLRTLLVPPLAALGALSSAFYSDAVQFLGGVPENVIVFALARVPRAAFRSRARVPLASLSVSMGLDVPASSP